MRSAPPFEREDILAVLPHRPPFLFVDRVTKLVPDKRIVAERTISPDEPQFQGHFPGHPIMPGVLITDALAQTSGLLIGLALIEGLNIVRLTSLFAIQRHRPDWFHAAHTKVWETVFVLFSVGLWALWAMRTQRRDES